MSYAIDTAQRRWCDATGELVGEAALRRTAAGLREVIDAVDSARQANRTSVTG